MPRYEDSSMDVYFDDRRRKPYLNWKCVVVLRRNQIVVEYDDNEWIGVRYEGVIADSFAELRLQPQGADGFATLAGAFREGSAVKGHWDEEGNSGTWKVFIGSRLPSKPRARVKVSG